jgi:hypothetical protein
MDNSKDCRGAIEMIIRDQQVTRPKIRQQFLGICDARGAMCFIAFQGQKQLRGGTYGIVVLEQYEASRGRDMRCGDGRAGVFYGKRIGADLG